MGTSFPDLVYGLGAIPTLTTSILIKMFGNQLERSATPKSSQAHSWESKESEDIKRP